MKLAVALALLVVLVILPQYEAATQVRLFVIAAIFIHILKQLNKSDYLFDRV